MKRDSKPTPEIAPAPRKRGRPRKLHLELPESAPAPRKRGRPRKVHLEQPETAPAPRKPGRPRKLHLEQPETVPAPRKPGRPRKLHLEQREPTPEPPKPGRSRKVHLEQPETAPAPRKPGRPRKVPPEPVRASESKVDVIVIIVEVPCPPDLAEMIRQRGGASWIRALVRAEMQRNAIARPLTPREVFAALGIDPDIIEHEGKPLFGLAGR